MRRCSERDWLTPAPGDAEPLDPDLVDDRLAELTFPGVLWDKLVDMDANEREAERRQMKVYLARYAHVPPDYWEGRELSELQAWFADTCELVKRENESGHVER